MTRERERVILDTGSVSRTKQSFKDDCDINLIVKRHASTGLWDHLAPRTPTYGDFSMATELSDAIALVNAAEADFDGLPAAVRAVCENNPVKMAEAFADPELFRELVEAGLPSTEPPRASAPITGGETPPATPPAAPAETDPT